MKKIVLCVSLLCIICSNLFSNADDSFSTFTEKTGYVIADNALTLNNTSESFIGRILPSVPPHFMFGASISVALMDTKYLSKAADDIYNANKGSGATSLPGLPKVFPLPTYSLSTRFGGFVLPFDFGITTGFAIPATGYEIKAGDVKFDTNFLSIVADIRYAILEGNGLAPKLSIGLGYAYAKHNYRFGTTDREGHTNIGLNLQTHTVFTQLQISKRFSFAVPYLGIKAYWTKNDSEYFYEIGNSDNKTAKSVYKDFNFADIQPQLYAGVGFMLPYSHITLGGSWNIRNNIWNITLQGGFRM